jgi:endogenous inhibitor of DNA gyrase (YacG/DUF329 family)
MIPLRYAHVRWVIAVLTLLLIVLFALLKPTGGLLVLFVLLLLASAGAVVAPPGIYLWLIRPVCPECGGSLEWTVEQGSKNPYWERLVVRCPACGKQEVEFSFDPTL